jgi:hypothetical protein
MNTQKSGPFESERKPMHLYRKAHAIFLTLFLLANIPLLAVQPDTLCIMQIAEAPKINGFADDAAWEQAQWIKIDQVWMPWKATISESDFSGRYKVLWSGKTNLLYFIAEITDDVLRDGYDYGKNNVTYSDYDIFEIFLDPDHSGGLHVFDGVCDDTKNPACWGVNAENAFTYHINANAPADGAVTCSKSVEDISGTDWDHKQIENYAGHLPDFAFHKNGNVYTYEFSLKVYKDTYNPEKPSEEDRDKLVEGKIMGLSAAYCDDDHPEGTAIRDNFIGSTPGNEKALDSKGNFNQTWMNSSYYGVVQLVVPEIYPSEKSVE